MLRGGDLVIVVFVFVFVVIAVVVVFVVVVVVVLILAATVSNPHGGVVGPPREVRLDLGVLQMEMEGRPDGARPESFESLLDYQKDRLERYSRQSGGAEGFVLSRDECRRLREEAVQYYHRYVGLFALSEYAGVVRDTTRNERPEHQHGRPEELPWAHDTEVRNG